MEITVWSFLLLFGCTQSLLLIAVFSLNEKNRHPRNLVLSLLFGTFALIALDHSLRLSTLYRSFPHLIYISDGLWYLIAPTLYFAAKLYVQPKYHFKWSDALHLTPFIIMQVIYWKLLTTDGTTKVRLLESYQNTGTYGLTSSLFILVMMIQILLYIIASLRLFKSYQEQYERQFSKNQLGQLKLFRGIYTFFLIYFAFEFSFSSIRNFTTFHSEFLDNWSLVVWTFFIYGIGYITMLSPDLILPQLSKTTDQNSIAPQTHDHSDLNRLIEYVTSTNAFKKEDLSLPDLAERLDMSTNRISYLINQVKGVNFYDFINTYRVLEVKKMLETGRHKEMSITGISQEAGFRSKASFYKFFKREFNMTPTQFISDLEKQV